MASTVAASLQNIFAPVLLGTWFNAMVFTLELILAYQYYSKKNLRSPGANTAFVRCLVAFQLFVDTAGTVGNCAYAYLMLVTHWGDLSYLALNPVAGAIDCFTSGISGFVVQLYLLWRYSILSKNYVVCVILALGATTAMGGAFGTGIASVIHREVSQRQEIVPITMVWFIGSVATDIGIAAALVVQLRSYSATFQSTRSIIHRLIVSTVQTGSATAIVSTLVLITFAIWPNTAIALAPGFVVGRVYGCTLLFNLTTRRMGEAGNSTDKSDERFSGSRAGGGVSGPRERATRLDTLGGIHVHHIVQVDQDRDIRGSDSKLGSGGVEYLADDRSVGEHKARVV